MDPEKLNEFSNKTAKRLDQKRKTDNATLLSYISSLKDKSNSFKLQLVTPTEEDKCIKHCATTAPLVTIISQCHLEN